VLGPRAKQASLDPSNHLHESFLAIESLPDESKQSFFNYIKEQKYISQIEDSEFEILTGEESKDSANG
jgi:hypothetical protein